MLWIVADRGSYPYGTTTHSQHCCICWVWSDTGLSCMWKALLWSKLQLDNKAKSANREYSGRATIQNWLNSARTSTVSQDKSTYINSFIIIFLPSWACVQHIYKSVHILGIPSQQPSSFLKFWLPCRKQQVLDNNANNKTTKQSQHKLHSVFPGLNQPTRFGSYC